MNNKWMHLLVALFSIAAAAGVDARPDRVQRGEAMMNALGLSDEQRMHIEKLREAHREEMRALRMSGARPDPQAMERLFDVHQRQIAETLTPEQREQLQPPRWLEHRSQQNPGPIIAAAVRPMQQRQQAAPEDRRRSAHLEVASGHS